MAGSYIVAGARTPIGKMSGALSSFSAADLGGFAIKAALERAGVKPEEVEHVIMGQVLMAGQGQVPSRQAASKAGIPMNVPSININKVCLSGLNSIYLADQMIASGEADIVVAGGMESMTNAPYLAQGARGGFRYGNTELQDAIVRDGLWCAFDACLMGLGTERYTSGGISRQEQDDLAMKSNQRAAAAIAAGKLAAEIVEVAVPQRKGDPVMVKNDEGVRADTTMDTLGGLKPAFDKEGTITAANASQISDGGSAVVLMSKKAAQARGVKPLGEVVSYGMVAGPDNASLLHQPSRSILKALDRVGLDLRDHGCVVPFDRTVQRMTETTLAIHEITARVGHGRPVLQRMTDRVHQDRKPRVHPLQKGQDGLPRLPEVHGEDPEPPFAESILKPLHRGHFPDTGGTPAGPEVHQHHLAGEFPQVPGLTLEVGQHQRRCGGARGQRFQQPFLACRCGHPQPLHSGGSGYSRRR